MPIHTLNAASSNDFRYYVTLLYKKVEQFELNL